MLKPKQKRYLNRTVEEYIGTKPKSELSLEEWFLRHHPEVFLFYLRERAQSKTAKDRVVGEIISLALSSISESLEKKDPALLSGAFCLLLKGIAEDRRTSFEKCLPTVDRALGEVSPKLHLFAAFECSK